VVIVELLLITAAVGIFASAKSYQPILAGGLMLLVIAWSVRFGYDRRVLRPTKLDWPLRLFLVSGLISLWASYNFDTSLAKFCLIVGSIALYYALNQAPLKIRLNIGIGLIVFAAALALYFITQENEIAAIGAGKFPLLTNLHATLRSVSPQLNLYQPHPNLVAGVLEIGLIIGVGVTLAHYQAWPPSRRATRQSSNQTPSPFLVPLILCLGLIALGLLLTGSRGAWLAVAGAGLGWFFVEMQHTSRLRLLDSLALLIILGSIIFFLFLQINGPAQASTTEDPSSVSRLTIYRGSSHLIRDYIFTGAGLGSFPMLYSAYVLEIDVVKQNHPHNLYLSVWLEQGLLGILALLWLTIAYISTYFGWRKIQEFPPKTNQAQAQRLLAAASFWTTIVFFAHGLIDSVHYNSRFLPLVFVVLGLGGFTTLVKAKPEDMPIRQAAQPRNLVIAGVVAGVVALLLWLWPPARASWYANLGAVEQSKIELSDYAWPDRIPSKVRPTADLSGPIQLFESALKLAPENATATERLDLIKQSSNQSSAN